MTKIFLTMCLALCCHYLMAQNETEFLLGNDATYEGFGGLITEVSQFNDQPMLVFGGGGGVIVSRKVFLGGYGMGNLVESYDDLLVGTDLELEFGHGGLWLGYLFQPEKVLHFGGSARLGWGGYSLTDATGSIRQNDDLFILSPQAEVEVNLLPFMKLNLAGGYRIALGSDGPIVAASDFSAPFALLGLYFGWFAD